MHDGSEGFPLSSINSYIIRFSYLFVDQSSIYMDGIYIPETMRSTNSYIYGKDQGNLLVVNLLIAVGCSQGHPGSFVVVCLLSIASLLCTIHLALFLVLLYHSVRLLSPVRCPHQCLTVSLRLILPFPNLPKPRLFVQASGGLRHAYINL